MNETRCIAISELQIIIYILRLETTQVAPNDKLQDNNVKCLKRTSQKHGN
jgi:hypothetical protein